MQGQQTPGIIRFVKYLGGTGPGIDFQNTGGVAIQHEVQTVKARQAGGRYQAVQVVGYPLFLGGG